MKKIFKLSPILVVVLLAFTGCQKKLEDMTKNNNTPNDVPASLLFNGVLNNMVVTPDGSDEVWDQYYLYNYDYYGNNRYDFGSGSNYYVTLKNVVAMEQEAVKAGAGAVNPYEALGKFFRAYYFTQMSLQMGDIPMTQALQGLTNLEPAYDSQKAVFQQAFTWLEQANTDLTALIASGDNTLTNDIYYSNDLSKWQKAVNAYRIRLLLSLSKRVTTDADLNLATQFSSIIGNPTKYPLFASSADNLQYTFMTPSNYYPETPDNFGQSGSRKNMSLTYMSLLTANKDPRVFVVAEPARHLVDDLKQSPTSFDSFVGADPGLDLGVMYNNAGLQYYSFINRKHFYSTYTGEPAIILGYPELEFEIAEGINRGWATGNAETYYMAGIQASMAAYGIPTSGTFTAYFYRPGSTSVTVSSNYDTYPISFDFTTWYAQSGIKYTADAAGLTKILQQKYIALFRHSGLESYFTYRRTGVPVFTTGSGTGNSGRIAWRFQYPTSERTANTTNYNKALASQYGGNDDINGVMWMLK